MGAVRHKGFIPLDDDIDVLMPRTDYEKFIANFPKDPLNKNFQMASVETMSGYYLPFAQLMRRGTSLKETVDTDLALGVYMDIFTLDNMSDNYDTAYKLGALKEQVQRLGQRMKSFRTKDFLFNLL